MLEVVNGSTRAAVRIERFPVKTYAQARGMVVWECTAAHGLYCTAVFTLLPSGAYGGIPAKRKPLSALAASEDATQHCSGVISICIVHKRTAYLVYIDGQKYPSICVVVSVQSALQCIFHSQVSAQVWLENMEITP